jgi:hypothetical protein
MTRPADALPVVKGWADPVRPTSRRRSTEPRPSPRGLGLQRRDEMVLVPELALLGADAFEFAVLEDPATGQWFGEEPAYPGTGLVPIDPDRCLPVTVGDCAVLEAVAREAARLQTALTAAASIARRERARARAVAAAAKLGAAGPDRPVIDLWRAALGFVPEPARWWRADDGVHLQTVRDPDDPLDWVTEWLSDEACLALVCPKSHAAAVRLAAVAEAPELDAQRIDGEVMRASTRRLREIAPALSRRLTWFPEE